MKITITAPKKFNFLKTVTTLQRGPQDPINLIAEDRWIRCLDISNKPVVVATNHDKDIFVNVLSDGGDAKGIKELISMGLGLDDPLINNEKIIVPRKKMLGDAWFITVPGFLCLFEAMVQIIMGQQVSVPVANRARANFTIAFGKRFKHKDKSYHLFPRAETIAKLNIQKLSTIGISQMKCKSILEIANLFVKENLGNKLTQAKNRQEIGELLNEIYGVGRWTIDWLALRALRQFDVIPSTDLVVRKAFTWWLDASEVLSIEAVDVFTESFYPLGGAVAYRILCAYAALLNKTKSIAI